MVKKIVIVAAFILFPFFSCFAQTKQVNLDSTAKTDQSKAEDSLKSGQEIKTEIKDVAAKPNPVIEVSVGDGTIKPKSSTDIPVNIGDISGLGIISIDLNFEYDNSLLSFTSLDSASDILKDSPAPVYNNKPGNLRIAVYNVKPFQGKGVLLKLRFMANAKVKPGATKIVLKKVILNDGKIGVSLKNGSINIQKK